MVARDTLGNIRRLLLANQRRQAEAETVRGEIGKPLGNEQYTIEVEDEPGYITVNAYDRGFISAFNAGSPRQARLPVKLSQLSDGTWITQPDFTRALSFLGDSAAAVNPFVGPHTHSLESGLVDAVELRRIIPGRVRVFSGMTVQIDPFPYRYLGAEIEFQGGTIDLTAYQGATVGKWLFVKVGINPATNLPVALAGVEYSNAVPATRDQIKAISFTSYIPLVAVRIFESDTAIAEESRFWDCRCIIGGGDVLASIYTSEEAQDAVGSILVDTASINFTYSDATPSIIADVLPAGVDHNALANLTTGDVHTQYLFKTPTTDARNVIQPSAATVTPLTIQGAASQSDPLTEWKNSAGTVGAAIDQDSQILGKRANGVQAKFYGWRDSVASADNGQIILGNNGIYYGSLSYEAVTGAILYIENALNNDNAHIIFRTKTLGTPVEPMAIAGLGKVKVGTGARFSSSNVALATLHTTTAAAPTTVVTTNNYLHVGGIEFGTDSYRLIGFGWVEASRTYFPAYIGYQEKANSGNTKGDLIFGTRDVETDTQPTERIRITAAGNVEVNQKITKYNNVATEGYGVPAIVDHVALTGQVANIASTNLSSAGTAGEYRISYYLLDTTADVLAGTLTVAFTWNDGVAAQTFTSATIALTTAGAFTQDTLRVHLGSGNIAYSATVTGIFGTSDYSLYITCERLN